MRNEINNEYFEWLFSLACGNRYSPNISYRKLLMYLHSREFIYLMPMDENRAADGMELRYRFTYEHYGVDDTSYIDGPCSILEMMIALAIRCETNIMDDPSVGDRTTQWFWEMIVNLGLGSMDDDRFDKRSVSVIIDRFLDREYSPDGRGGLFIIRNCEHDLRTVEIWYQLCWYLDNIV